MKNKLTVFVVDDDPSVCRSLARLLKAAGYCAATFSSPREFLQCCEPTMEGAAVIDVQMPEMSGLEVQRRLAEGDRRPAVILITAHDDEEARRQGLAQGAVAYLRKPFEDEELLAWIDRAFRESGSAPESTGVARDASLAGACAFAPAHLAAV